MKSTFSNIVYITQLFLQNCQQLQYYANQNIPIFSIMKMITNERHKTLQNTSCKRFYCHFINTDKHKPTELYKWAESFAAFSGAEDEISAWGT